MRRALIRVADYVMQFLHEQGINHIFTVTGRGILYLTDALARCEGLQAVSVHHEQAASYAVYAYAQCHKGVGACLVSTGCASTNAVTGVLCSWQDSVSTIFISGQNTLRETTHYTKLDIRTYGQQEADIVSLVQPITKYAVMITKAQDVAYELEKAVYMAHEGRKGPVWIDIPLDIQNMRIDPNSLTHFESEKKSMCCSDAEIAQVIAQFARAKRPVVLIGSGIRLAEAEDLFIRWIEKNQIPVVFSPSAADIYGVGETYSFGAVGCLGGSRVGNFTMQNADFLLVIGSQLSSMITGEQYEKFAREANVCVVDVDKKQHSKEGIQIDLFIHCDAKEFLEKLEKKELDANYNDWMQTCMRWKNIFPLCEKRHREKERVDLHYLGEVLSKNMQTNSVLLSDAGFEELIIPATISMKRGQRLIHPVAQGAMGFSLPASIGAYMADGGKQVVTINGDGSIMMNLQELQTIAFYQLPIKIIVANNNCYAVIRKRQQDLFRTRTIGTDESNGVACPEYEKVAVAFGIPYKRIEDSQHLEQELKNCLQQEGPILIEIMCVKEQEYLHNSFTRGESGKMVRRGLEDQSPFLERKLFLQEMIVEPIDQ